MLSRVQRRWLWLGAGLLLRLALIYFPRPGDDDTGAYLELGRNLLHHGVYGMTADNGTIAPSLYRLPGYPVVLALFGGHLRIVEIVQSLMDLWGCWLLSLVVTRERGERAGEAALALGSLCLFTAAYAATPLTESLSIFAVCWGIYGFSEWRRVRERSSMLSMAGAAALAMLLRPDGALLTFALLTAIGWDCLRNGQWRRWMRESACLLALACLPLGVWAVRNYASFHVFQPLAPRHVNDPNERPNVGFYRWLRTWTVDYVSTGDIFWQVDGNPLYMRDVPPRGFDSAQQRAETERLFAAYNVRHVLTAEIDDDFAKLAADRVRAHPVQYYVEMPVLRAADMWLRPRGESFSLDMDWWRWQKHPAESAMAIALGLLNLGYVLLALVGWMRGRVPVGILLGSYLLLRCILLGGMENSEPRYSLEAYPVVIIAVACVFAERRRVQAVVAEPRLAAVVAS